MTGPDCGHPCQPRAECCTPQPPWPESGPRDCGHPCHPNDRCPSCALDELTRLSEEMGLYDTRETIRVTWSRHPDDTMKADAGPGDVWSLSPWPRLTASCVYDEPHQALGPRWAAALEAAAALTHQHGHPRIHAIRIHHADDHHLDVEIETEQR